VRHTWERIGLLYLTASFALVGFWAACAPRSFYGSFPGGGRHWVAPDGRYNEHLVRDVGELNLALFVVLLVATITLSGPLVRAALAATIVNGGLHLAYHAGHVDMFGTGDQVAMLASLALAPLVAVVLLVATPRRRSRVNGTGDVAASAASD
jgi:hypothetical protein